ncbi:MAG: FeoA family protein [Verrucomicrobiales bacterium]
MSGSSTQPLSSLLPGHSGKVAEIKITGTSRARLMEMGLIIGTPVEVIRFAPLGDPVEIKVRGYHLTLRRHEADLILVGNGVAK